MSDFARAPLTAILGPTNTGKTYLAVERMCGHSSGMIGFPLRLLARWGMVARAGGRVYAVAEMLRRMRGGAAVVLGALSPRTRNAQVARYQAGEVDYLVATDAVGMGLNMDVSHVAFAGLSKYDGRRRRRLTPAEMAQIAGRAGRHQRDGTFGVLTLEGELSAEFRPEEIEAIEEHRFAPLDHHYWRESDPDYRSVEGLIRSLERRPTAPGLRAAPEAVDLAVLKRLAEDPGVRERAKGADRVRRLWAASGLPDFRKAGADHHARLV